MMSTSAVGSSPNSIVGRAATAWPGSVSSDSAASLRQRYREGQDDQLGALGLVVNALILWNTRYMDAAVNQLKSRGFEPKPEDLARLWPLRSRHFNVLGRYHFTVTDSVLKSEMRPLRDPAPPQALEEPLDDENYRPRP